MEAKKITITEDALLEAYKNGDNTIKEAFERLYGIEMFHPKSIMDRIKTFDDAINELGENHPLVKEYRRLDNPTTDHLAYMKIRIIVTALNEGWEPQFTDNEARCYPYFFFYTKKQYDNMSKERRANLILFGTDAEGSAYAGLVYADSNRGPSSAVTAVGSRLCFKTRELAEYAGKQFIELYYDFCAVKKASNYEHQNLK